MYRISYNNYMRKSRPNHEKVVFVYSWDYYKHKAEYGNWLARCGSGIPEANVLSKNESKMLWQLKIIEEMRRVYFQFSTHSFLLFVPFRHGPQGKKKWNYAKQTKWIYALTFVVVVSNSDLLGMCATLLCLVRCCCCCCRWLPIELARRLGGGCGGFVEVALLPNELLKILKWERIVVYYIVLLLNRNLHNL